MEVFENIKKNFKFISPLKYIIILHSLLFAFILFLSIVYFQNDIINSYWASYRNDSWKFIENTIKIENPPYSYHLITSSFHFFFVYIILSTIFNSNFSLLIAVISIQYLFSLLTIGLLYLTMQEIFSLNEKETLLYVWLIDSVVFSLFFTLATAEILFIFYQTFSFYLLIRKRYFFASISAGLTLALRFNGAIFVMGFLFLLILSIVREEMRNILKLFKIIINFFTITIVSLIPFIYSHLIVNDFFFPLTSEFTAYSTWESYVADNQIFVIPFTFWPTYIEWVFNRNELSEYLLLLAALVTFLLGFFSLFIYNMYKKDFKRLQNIKFNYLMILAFINFLGVNIIVSGRNFARFISFSFPIFPLIIYAIYKLNLNDKAKILIGLFSFLLSIVLNLIWWLNTDFCEHCQHML